MFGINSGCCVKFGQIFVHGAVDIVSIQTDKRQSKKERRGNGPCNQLFVPSPLIKCCFGVTTLDWASQSLTVNGQLAAMSSRLCILDSPGGLLTLDLALIGWLRKFHKWIGPFLLFTKPRCEAFLCVYCVLWCLSVPFLFHFLQNTPVHVTQGGVTTKAMPEPSRCKPGEFTLHRALNSFFF